MHLTLLGAAMCTLFLTIILGGWLSALYLLREEPPRGMITGLIHGTLGTTTVTLSLLALMGKRAASPTAVPTSAGGFGWTAFAILAATLVGGLTILTLHFRRKPISPVLLAMHACGGIAGGVILAAYWTTRASFGR